jgi:hypothetical protein
MNFNIHTQDTLIYPEIPTKIWHLKNKEKASIKLEKAAKQKLIENKKDISILIIDSTHVSGSDHANKLRVLLQDVNLKLKIDEEEYTNVWNKTYEEYKANNNKNYNIIITSTRAEHFSEYLNIEKPYEDIKSAYEGYSKFYKSYIESTGNYVFISSGNNSIDTGDKQYDFCNIHKKVICVGAVDRNNK